VNPIGRKIPAHPNWRWRGEFGFARASKVWVAADTASGTATANDAWPQLHEGITGSPRMPETNLAAKVAAMSTNSVAPVNHSSFCWRC